MDVKALLFAALADPFRIVLLIGLMITAANTAPPGGRPVLPIVLGLFFVAVLIPTAFGVGAAGTMSSAIMIGLIANVVIYAILSLAKAAFDRFRT